LRDSAPLESESVGVHFVSWSEKKCR